MDLPKHECRSVISAQSIGYSQGTDLKIIRNNNNESVNGDSVIHATASKAPNCDYDDGDNGDMNAAEISENFTDSCGSDKMNVTDVKTSGQAEDKDKVSGE